MAQGSKNRRGTSTASAGRHNNDRRDAPYDRGYIYRWKGWRDLTLGGPVTTRQVRPEALRLHAAIQQAKKQPSS